MFNNTVWIFLAFGSCIFSASTFAEEELQPFLNAAYPTAEIILDTDKTGVLKDAQTVTKFYVSNAQEFEYESERYWLVFLQIEKTGNEVMGIEDTQYESTMLIGKVNAPHQIKKLQLMHGATSSSLTESSPPIVQDYFNDGSKQVLFELSGIWSRLAPTENIGAAWVCMYSLSDGKPVFIIEIAKRHLTEDGIQLDFEKQYSFYTHKDGLHEIPMLRLEDNKTGEAELIPFTKRGMPVDMGDDIWSTLKPIPKPEDVPDGSIALKIVDEQGKSIPNQTLKVTTVRSNVLLWTSESSEFEGMTDNHGNYVIKNPKGIVHVDIYRTGFFKKHTSFGLDVRPEERIIVVLERKPVAVPLLKNSFNKIWPFGQEKYAVGIVFNEKRDRLTIPVSWSAVEEREDADIWVEMELVSKPDPKGFEYEILYYQAIQWRVRLTGLKGWKLAPGPAREKDVPKEKIMMIAPETEYVQVLELEYEESRNMSGVFLQKNGGKLYGKLIDLWGGSTKKYEEEPIAGISCGYLIQREDVKSRSLFTE